MSLLANDAQDDDDDDDDEMPGLDEEHGAKADTEAPAKVTPKIEEIKD